MSNVLDFSISPVETAPPQNALQTGFLGHDSSSSPSEQPQNQRKQSTPPAPNGLNSRSCVTCRKRKVKCDKRYPCSNCNKAAIECHFPGPGRAPRRSRKPPDTELLARLRRLEGVVQTLGKGIDDDGSEITIEAQVPAPAPAPFEPVQPNGKEDEAIPIGGESKSSCGKMMSMHEPGQVDTEMNGTIKEFGRLVVDEGRSRYVSNKFWTSLSEEVAELQDILDDPTDEEDDYPSPASGESNPANHNGFIFGFSSVILSLRNFHPPSPQITSYWNIYKTNIAPVMKPLHTPHTENMVYAASRDLEHINRPTEALLFSIYFAVVTSVPEAECVALLGIERPAALRKYRFACEQAFARASFLNTQDILVLQAMLLFLTAVRHSDDTRYVWTLVGILIRLAISLGIHRDGAQFGLSPFETELRRRLWWQICTLDVRASEDHGCEPSIIESSFDTKFPLNINDADISPSMVKTPEEHECATEMTFDLIRYSVSTTLRRLSYAPPGPGPCRTKSSTASLEDKERMIEELHQYIEKKYLRYLDTSIPLHWVAATVARLIMAKMWLVVHHPLQRSDAGAGLPLETRDRLFTTSIEVIEFSRLLETEKATLKWGWLFRTYVQWHALAFVLSQLCLRTEGPQVDKAWMVIERVFDEWGGALLSNQRGMMWKPLRKLMIRARAARQHALERRMRFPLDGSLGPAITTPLVTEPGAYMNGSAGDVLFSPSARPPPGMANTNASHGAISAAMDAAFDPSGLRPFDGSPSDQMQQQQPHPNAISTWNNNIMTSGGDAASGVSDPGSVDPWQYSTAQAPATFAGTAEKTAVTNGFGEEHAMVMGGNWTGWDDMVKEFQMDGGVGWAGVEI